MNVWISKPDAPILRQGMHCEPDTFCCFYNTLWILMFINSLFLEKGYCKS